MTREQAIREARKRWGARAMVRANDRVGLSSQEQRQAGSAQVKEWRERKEAIEREINERLAKTDWYQELSAERKKLYDQIQKNQWRTSYYKFAVGRDIGIAFSVEGQGDTWEQAFASAEQK